MINEFKEAARRRNAVEVVACEPPSPRLNCTVTSVSGDEAILFGGSTLAELRCGIPALPHRVGGKGFRDEGRDAGSIHLPIAHLARSPPPGPHACRTQRRAPCSKSCRPRICVRAGGQACRCRRGMLHGPARPLGRP